MWECLNAKPARSLSKNLANWLSESLRRKLWYFERFRPNLGSRDSASLC
jgi:hypothetical protein